VGQLLPEDALGKAGTSVPLGGYVFFPLLDKISAAI
jgi:hypothetical protein